MTEEQNRCFWMIKETLADIDQQLQRGMPYRDLQGGLSGLGQQILALRGDLIQRTRSLGEHLRPVTYREPEKPALSRPDREEMAPERCRDTEGRDEP